MDCPKTNQMSATRPAQIPATSQRSEILSRISQDLIAKRQVLAVKIGLVLNLNSKTVLALSIRQFRRALGSFDGKVELACFRVGCRDNVVRHSEIAPSKSCLRNRTVPRL